MVPFLKWPGGKRWFVTRYAQLLPSEYGTYIEPFLGSGAVFFHLQPQKALLGDTNEELIATYRAIRSDPAGVRRHLRDHHRYHNAEYYYAVRCASMRTGITRAARFVYLNRTCFNGIYRVNLAGTFNVPIGTKTAVLLDSDDFGAVARILRRASLRPWDFERLIDRAVAGDLVFADPPYTVRHNNNGFVKYNETLFSWADQERLAKALTRAAGRGVKVVATNADHDEVAALYHSPAYCLDHVERYSAISSDSTSRRAYRELVVRANCD
jgi:DNA adenine methylase